MYTLETTPLGETAVFRADTLADLAAWAAPHGKIGTEYRRHDWVGRRLRSAQDALAAAQSPWPDGVARVQDMLAAIADHELPAPVSRRRVQCWRDDGDELSRERLESGWPAWRTTIRQQRQGPAVVTVAIDLAARSIIDSADISWRAAAAIAATERLEAAGYAVELICASVVRECYRDGRSAATMMVAKDAGQPLDIDGLASATSGWAYRSLWIDAKTATGWSMQSYYGHPASAADVPGLFPQDCHYLAPCFDRAAAIAASRKLLEEIASPEN